MASARLILTSMSEAMLGGDVNTLLTPTTVLELVSEKYDLPQPQRCNFIRRGFNDHYEITAGETRYIFRVYLNGKYYVRSADAFRFELDLLDYLHKRKVRVAYPLPQSDGTLLGWTSVGADRRAFALFSYAPGETVEELPSAKQSLELGKTIASFHLAANTFASRHERYHLDLEYLAEQPLKLIGQQDSKEIREALEALQPVDELIDAVKRFEASGDEYGIIHGDIHPGNLHFQGDRITLFDFDHCAYGWRAYDLTPALSLPDEQREAFLQGYESLRPLSEDERALLPTFAKLRTLWDIGDFLATETLRALPN